MTTLVAFVLLSCLTSTTALADGDSMGGGGKSAPISSETLDDEAP